MGCCCYCSISKEYFSTAIKVILLKIVFDFTVGRLSKKCKKYCFVDLCLLFATKVHKEAVFKSAIYTTSVSLTIKSRIWASHKTGVISTCENYEIFMKRLSFGLYILPFYQDFSSLAHAFLKQISSGVLLCTIKFRGDSADN